MDATQSPPEYVEGHDDTPEWDNLTHAQHRALVALISEPKMQDAAKKAGIGRNTLYKWLRQPDFQAAYRKARQHAMAEATATLQRHSTGAADVLAEVMYNKDEQGAVRVTAARSVLDFSARFTRDEDFAERLAALEEGVEAEDGDEAS